MRRARRSALVRVCCAQHALWWRASAPLREALIVVLHSGAPARGSPRVSKAWSCVVRRIPCGKLYFNVTRVASHQCREEHM